MDEAEPSPPSRPVSSNLASAAPSTGARALAILAILIAGAAGGLIGFGFIDLQCDDGCSTAAALGGLVGAVICAFGVAVVAVLTLRAMGEWSALEAQKERTERAD